MGAAETDPMSDPSHPHMAQPEHTVAGGVSSATPFALMAASRRRRRMRLVAVGAALAAAFAAFATVMISRTEPVQIATIASRDGSNVVQVVEHGGSPAAVLWPLIAIMAGLFVMVRVMRRRADAGTVLGGAIEIGAVGQLAEALWDAEPYVRTEAEEALISLLPRLKASDAHLLNPGQRACLHRAVRAPRRKRQADLVVAIIGALTEIGDEKALPHVERLAEEPVKGALQEQVRSYAASQLPIMRQSIENVRAARTLVRPADDVGTETLLRPADGAPTGPVEHLVRPASPGSDA